MKQGMNLSGRRAQRGLSIIELMIAMVIGMVTVGAVFAAYLAAGQSSRHSQAMAQISEDANAAFAVLRSHVAMAGFSRPISQGSGGAFVRAYSGAALFGCDQQFVDTAIAIGALTCQAAPASGTVPDAVAVAFEADASNAVASSGVPVDCLGSSLALEGTAPNQYYLSTARFFVDAGALKCRGVTSTGAQALVENVVDMQVRYGVPDVAKGPITWYGDAADLGSDAALWGRAESVRVCVVVASEQQVLDDVAAYTPCFPANYGDTVTPTDRRLYRAFTTTIVLHNRTPNA